ncbi:unnamed protein product [Coffea canephora]|uniref:Uncharacterized protein n=1 Tax=Coffea canephora TaxID=49390 RepID=A0A068V8I4_COFCA|nr:unnamed protein product [Coffea canephora]
MGKSYGKRLVYRLKVLSTRTYMKGFERISVWGSFPVHKARRIAQGFNQPDNSEVIQNFLPTFPLLIRLFYLIWKFERKKICSLSVTIFSGNHARDGFSPNCKHSAVSSCAVTDVIYSEVYVIFSTDISWGEVKEGGSFSITAPLSQSTYYEVFLEDQKREVAATQFRVQSWSSSHESTPLVVPGCILTATDKLLNVQPFDESKILIVKVNQATGFEGLIVNKHINWESLEELEEGLQKLKGAPLSYGGPVMKQGMPLVALAQKFVDDKHPEVLPDVYFLDQWATLRLMDELKLGNKSVRGHWFFLGFSSWGWEQLFHEIAEGAWHVSKGNTEHLDWPEIF